MRMDSRLSGHLRKFGKRSEGIRRNGDRVCHRGSRGISDHPYGGVRNLAYTLLQCRREASTYFHEIEG